MIKLICDCTPGDEILLVGTVDFINSNGTIYVVLEGQRLGRVALVPGDVIASVTGRSPNYGESKKPRRRRRANKDPQLRP